MKLPVLIEANPAGGFTAKLGPPFGLVGHGGTSSAAAASVKHALEQSNLRGQITFIDVDVGSEIDPIAHLLDDPASLPNDAITEDWKLSIAARRLERERDDEISGRVG